MILALLDWGLTLLHLAVVLANLLLWWWPATRRLHLALVALTTLSWLGLGQIFGLGYCVLTDWHGRVKHARGATEIPHSFLHYLLVDTLRLPLSAASVELMTASGFAVVAILSIVLNALSELKRGRAARDRRSKLATDPPAR